MLSGIGIKNNELTYLVASFYVVPHRNSAAIPENQSHLACRDTCRRNKSPLYVKLQLNQTSECPFIHQNKQQYEIQPTFQNRKQ